HGDRWDQQRDDRQQVPQQPQARIGALVEPGEDRRREHGASAAGEHDQPGIEQGRAEPGRTEHFGKGTEIEGPAGEKHLQQHQADGVDDEEQHGDDDKRRQDAENRRQRLALGRGGRGGDKVGHERPAPAGAASSGRSRIREGPNETQALAPSAIWPAAGVQARMRSPSRFNSYSVCEPRKTRASTVHSLRFERSLRLANTSTSSGRMKATARRPGANSVMPCALFSQRSTVNSPTAVVSTTARSPARSIVLSHILAIPRQFPTYVLVSP